MEKVNAALQSTLEGELGLAVGARGVVDGEGHRLDGLHHRPAVCPARRVEPVLSRAERELPLLRE
jgi:hypothetical protein